MFKKAIDQGLPLLIIVALVGLVAFYSNYQNTNVQKQSQKQLSLDLVGEAGRDHYKATKTEESDRRTSTVTGTKQKETARPKGKVAADNNDNGQGCVYGDTDFDGKHTAFDVSCYQNYLAKNSNCIDAVPLECVDLNCNGKADIGDALSVKYKAGTGKFDGNVKVDDPNKKVWIDKDNNNVPDCKEKIKKITCGTDITVDTVLTEDLLDCPMYGLFIAGSGITLDCNGHTITHKKIKGYPYTNNPGIVTDGNNNIIKNCNIIDFDPGIFLPGINNKDVPMGVSNNLVVNNLIKQNIVQDEENVASGIKVGGKGNNIINNNINKNSLGIVIGGYDHLIQGNTIHENSVGVLSAVSGSTNIIIKQNIITQNKEGLKLDRFVNSFILDNIIKNNAVGVMFEFYSAYNHINNNQVINNLVGLNLSKAFPLVTDDEYPSDNLIESNVVCGNVDTDIYVQLEKNTNSGKGNQFGTIKKFNENSWPTPADYSPCK